MKKHLKVILTGAVSLVAAAAVLWGVIYGVGHTYFGATALAAADTPKTVSRESLDEAYRKGVRSLGAEALAQLSGEDGNNQMLSPLGMSLCYSMLLSGAGGDTRDELMSALGMETLSGEQILENSRAAFEQSFLTGDKVKLRIASALWCDRGYAFRQSFLDGCKNQFFADIYEQDFSDGTKVVRNINKWAKNKSGGSIPSILDELDPDSVMVLANAVYFEGRWKDSFDKKRTAAQAFYAGGDREISCDFMHSKEAVKYKKTDRFEAVSIPYESDFSMVLAMPAQGERPQDLLVGDTLRDILEYTRWEYGEVTDADGVLRYESSEANLAMPKFRFACELDMIPVLQQLGVNLAFTEQADFSGMSDTPDLYVGALKQKSFIDINEEKTIAISINLGIMNCKSADPASIVDAVFDRPFVFAIVDEEGLPLFMGILNDPSAE